MNPKKIYPMQTQQNAIALITAAKMMVAGLIAFIMLNPIEKIFFKNKFKKISA